MKGDILGFRVDSRSADVVARDILHHITSPSRSDGRWLACINPHSYVVAKEDQAFAAALRAADWLVPDGIGIVLAGKVLGEPVAERVTGPDVFHRVMSGLNEAGGRVYFLGSSEETLGRIQRRLSKDFPNLVLAGRYSPPFRPSFTEEDSRAMVSAVNAAKPDVLWVGLTAPKQEKWIFERRDQLQVPFTGAIGAVFDFYAGTVKRSPAVFQQFGLEWLPRLLQEPRRLWRRTFVSAPLFLWDLVLARVGVPRTRQE